MAPRSKVEDSIDPEDCQHPGRPVHPRLADEGKSWHCELCDTSFTVTVLNEALWREL